MSGFPELHEPSAMKIHEMRTSFMSPSHPSHALQQKNKTDIKKDQDKKKKGKRVTDTTFRALTRNLIFWEEKTQMWDSKPLV